MNKNLDPVFLQLERLGSALAQDIDDLTDDEVLAEAQEVYGDPRAVADRTKRVIQEAIDEHGQRRLQAAQSRYREDAQRRRRSKIRDWSVEQKNALLEKIWANPGPGSAGLTSAARNEIDLHADPDDLIEDLIDLGVIDEEGEIQR